MIPMKEDLIGLSWKCPTVLKKFYVYIRLSFPTGYSIGLEGPS